MGAEVLSASMEEAIRRALENGVIVICAAGNFGTSDFAYPAAYPTCLSVGAADRAWFRVPESNFGEWVDVAAPGIEIVGGWVDGTVKELRGTSSAAPHVAGLAGLLWSAGFSTPEQVRDRIEATARRVTEPWVRAGHVDALRALGGLLLRERGSLRRA